METTNNSDTSANIITETSIENAVFLADLQRRRMINRVNPFSSNNAMDRYSSLAFRTHATDLGKKITAASATDKKLAGMSSRNTSIKAVLAAKSDGSEKSKEAIEAANYRYEKQSVFYLQHFNVFASWMGIGTAVNSAGFAATAGSMPLTEAVFGLCYQSIVAGLQGTIQFGNRFRYSNELKPKRHPDDKTLFSVGSLFAPRTRNQWKELRYTLDGGAGSDTLTGGYGNDIYLVDKKSGNTIVEGAGGGIDTVLIDSSLASGLGTYSLLDNAAGRYIEGLVATNATAAAINLVGNDLNNVVWGNDFGSRLEGGDGDDIVLGRCGNDTVSGGTGNDIYYLGTNSGQDIIHDEGGTNTLYIDANHDQVRIELEVLTGYENVMYVGGNIIKVPYVIAAPVAHLSVPGNNDISSIRLGDLTDSMAGSIARIVTKDSFVMLNPSTSATWQADATVSNLITAMAQMAPPSAGTTLTTADYNTRVSAIYAANVI